jgi:hypothetical protein
LAYTDSKGDAVIRGMMEAAEKYRKPVEAMQIM